MRLYNFAVMAFSAAQSGNIASMMDAYIERNRPPEHIRPKLDIGWRVDKQTVYVFEIRPQWNKPTVTDHHDIAKATWVEQAKEWRVYWMRGNLTWNRYNPLPSIGNLQRFLIELEKDPSGCFWG